MRLASEIEMRDRALIQIVDAALAEAARKSGTWLVCRPGCYECCRGPFEITQLDASRLRVGLAELQTHDPEHAARVRARARSSQSGDDELCPALDPKAGTCDLYQHRPMTCRAFGPPVSCGAEVLGVCELCYHGATDAEIAACAVEIDPQGLEPLLIEDVERATGARGTTSVAACLCDTLEA
jgi:Fe-S-cluster containining protein